MRPTLHDVLHEAASPSFPPPDGFERALRRGRRLRRRALVVRSAAVPVVLAVVLVAIVSSGGAPQRVETVDDRRVTTTTVPLPRPVAPPTSTATTAVDVSGADDSLSLPAGPVPLPSEEPQAESTPLRTEHHDVMAFSTGSGMDAMRTDGTARTHLVQTKAEPYAWSSDHRTLIVTDEEHAGSAIFAVDVATGERREIVRPDNATVFGADLSPDGARIVFWTRDDDVVRVDSRPWDHLWIVNLDGSGLRELPEPGQQPSWSPDGTRILFNACVGGGSYICSMKADGSDVIGLEVPMFAWPRWSPDGRWIAGIVDNDRLAVARVDGSEERRIADHVASIAPPAWTGDSERLVYRRDADTPDGDGTCEGCDLRQGLFSVGIRGGDDAQLTDSKWDYHPLIPWPRGLA
jgi:dipeptidyl aminopeptidase/acylaminoacyl peptidase